MGMRRVARALRGEGPTLGQIDLPVSAWVARAPDGVVRQIVMDRVPIDRRRAHLSGLDPDQLLCRAGRDTPAAFRLEKPWRVDPHDDGDVDGAPWALDPSGQIDPFPAGFYEDPQAGLLVLHSMRVENPAGGRTTMFVKPLPEGQCVVPQPDGEPVAVPVYVVAAGRGFAAAVRAITDGTAHPTTTLTIGPRRPRSSS